MASSFDRWEKDPFFSAAEEVQESADRMESTYRTWIHAKKDSSGSWNMDELRRDLQTTLGTTKWQLDEFGRAVRSSYASRSSADDAKDRHRDFIIAIENQVSEVENSLNESTDSKGKPPLPWVRLDEVERNELALFLSGPLVSSVNKTIGRGKDRNKGEVDRPLTPEYSRSSLNLVEQGQDEVKEGKLAGHRRSASVGADISSWNIAVDDGVMLDDSSNVQQGPPPRKIPSFSRFLNTMESSMAQLKWSKSGYKKLKNADRHHDSDTALPISQSSTNGMNVSYERNKSCLDGCDEYDKHIYGWYGALQRQLQRSQYHMQYSRPVQVVSSVILLMFLLVLLAVHSI